MGFFDKIKAGLEKTRRQMGGVFAEFTGENEEFFDELEEALIVADSGADTAYKAVSSLRDMVRERSLLGREEVKAGLVEVLSGILSVGSFELKLDTKPSVILMVGVNGVGKTTTIGKLAAKFTAQGKKVLLAAGDTFRAAAAEQLTVWAERSGADIVKHGEGSDPGAVVFDALSAAKARGTDIVIIDTAGRLHIDEALMDELKNIKAAVKPHEILLVVDAMTGQDAVNVAKTFDEALDISGVLMSKMDGDARGGAALSVKAVTGKPIMYIGTGEKLDNIEAFHPDRMASRILGMGDVLTLIEKAQQAVDQKQAVQVAKKMSAGKLTLTDFYEQLQQVKNMGSMEDMLGMIPGLDAKALSGAQLDGSAMRHTEAIIQSMTPKERDNPSIINYSRKKRIAAGCGLKIEEVNKLLKQFEAMQKMTKQLAGMQKRAKKRRGKGGFPGFGGFKLPF